MSNEEAAGNHLLPCFITLLSFGLFAMALQPSLLLLVLALLYISPAKGQERKTCYSVNGTPDPAMSACNATAAQSSCCYSDSYCLSNGLCFGQSALYGNRLSRVGCTDASWRDPACFQNCKTGIKCGSRWPCTNTDRRCKRRRRRRTINMACNTRACQRQLLLWSCQC